MTLEAQEDLLLQLLFDGSLRDAFLRDRAGLLARFALEEHERADFMGIKAAGLRVDARDRANLVLGRLARSYPLSVGALAAVDGGTAFFASALTPAHFRLPGNARTAHLGATLHARLKSGDAPGNGRQRPFMASLLEMETASARSVGALRDALAAGQEPPPLPPAGDPPQGWELLPLALPPFVSVHVLPASLPALQKLLAPFPPDEAWTRARENPTPRARLAQAMELPRSQTLVVVRAVVERAFRVEANVGHRVLEVSQGFGPVFQALDGRRSAEDLLRAFADAGAPVNMLASIAQGLWQLVTQGVLRAQGLG